MRRPRRSPHPGLVQLTALRPGDTFGEAVAGLLQRPARSVLTMLGTVLGIGAFVAVLGLTATAGSQIDQDFTALKATQVTLQDAAQPAQQADGSSIVPPVSFPSDAGAKVAALTGVVHAGVWWQTPLQNPSVAPSAQLSSAPGGGILVYAADPGALAAMQPTMKTGVLYNDFHQGHGEHVAVLGSAAAQSLGISRVDDQPAVFVNGQPYTVVGIIDDVRREPEMLLGVIIPTSTALAAYGPPTQPRASMLIQTRVGAAQLVARQAPPLLRPDDPQLFTVIAPPDPHGLHDSVTGSFNSLFVLLAAICLAIGAVGIANITLVAVLERTAEIGLRRSLGARPRHIAAQFLAESTALGTLGGLIGTSAGVAVVVVVAMARQWTAVLEPWAVLPAPLIGTVVGLLAGLYPAMRAARIEPVEALRR